MGTQGIQSHPRLVPAEARPPALTPPPRALCVRCLAGRCSPTHALSVVEGLDVLCSAASMLLQAQGEKSVLVQVGLLQEQPGADPNSLLATCRGVAEELLLVCREVKVSLPILDFRVGIGPPGVPGLWWVHLGNLSAPFLRLPCASSSSLALPGIHLSALPPPLLSAPGRSTWPPQPCPITPWQS